MKELTNNEKARLIAMGKQHFRQFIERRQKLQNRLEVVEATFDMEHKLQEYDKAAAAKRQEYVKKLQDKLSEKTDSLKKQIEDNVLEQEQWIPDAVKNMLGKYTFEDIFDFEYVSEGDTSKRTLTAVFKYPTILPPGAESEAEALCVETATIEDEPEDEGPEFDGAGFSGTDYETEVDMRLAGVIASALDEPEEVVPGVDITIEDEPEEEAVDADQPEIIVEPVEPVEFPDEPESREISDDDASLFDDIWEDMPEEDDDVNEEEENEDSEEESEDDEFSVF